MDDASFITSSYNVQPYRKLDRIIDTIIRDAFLINYSNLHKLRLWAMCHRGRAVFLDNLKIIINEIQIIISYLP